MISAIIIYAKSCDKDLFERAKKSVSWCDELILVHGSADKGSFNDWRNEGLKKAKGDWILYLDTDEEITEELKDEIQKLITDKTTDYTYFAIPRRNFIFNQEFKHSGQYPDYQKRLFRRKNLVRWQGEVHEEPVLKVDSIGHLKNPMIHNKKMTISDMVEKTNKWSEIEAKLMLEANHPPMNMIRFTSAFLREFFKKFIIEKAFLDGKLGVIYGIYQIYSKLISYSKLWEMQTKANN